MNLNRNEVALVHVALMDLRRVIEERECYCEEERKPYYKQQLQEVEAVILRLEKEYNYQ